MSCLPPGTARAAAAVAHVRNLARGGPIDPSWRVTVHFHPDRLAGAVPILRAMAADSRYRSQFETSTSNGVVSRHPGYRGPDIVEAAASTSRDGILDARIIGAAVREGLFDGQVLKRVWHCTARFGHPVTDH